MKIITFQASKSSKGDFSYVLKIIYWVNNFKYEKSIVFYNLGNTYYQMQKYQKALCFYQKALSLNPHDFDTQYNYELTLLQLQRKNHKEKSALSQKIKLLPKVDQVSLDLITKKEQAALKKYFKNSVKHKSRNKFDW
ncbi:MAG: tetratricopeptide repeat protein [Candidatus Margulisiibacteriota bacterium]